MDQVDPQSVPAHIATIFREHAQDELQIAGVGLIFCFVVSFVAFGLALTALPVKAIVVAEARQMQQLGSDFTTGNRQPVTVLTVTPRRVETPTQL